MRLALQTRFAIALALTLFFGSVTSSAQVLSTQIEAIFASLKSKNAPGAAVLVVRNGQPIFRRGYGVTDLRTLHPIDAQTNFRLASFTKQFTAACIMLLVRDGKLHYDDHLTDFLPEFPAYGKPITIRNLLNHTSGLPDYEDILMKQYPNTAEEKIPQIVDAGVLKLLEQQTRGKFAPGSKWEYSNSGYAVLAMIVEKVSGKSFAQFLQERIFTPLKMTNTLAYEKGKNEVPHRAFGHSKINGAWRQGSRLCQREGALRMQVLIQDLLAFSESAETELRSASVDCNAVMEEVRQTLSTAIQESGTLITHGKLPAIWTDRTQITQVFQNLIGNAIKFPRERTTGDFGGGRRTRSSMAIPGERQRNRDCARVRREHFCRLSTPARTHRIPG